MHHNFSENPEYKNIFPYNLGQVKKMLINSSSRELNLESVSRLEELINIFFSPKRTYQ
jgi:hypothetical protein